MPVIIIVLVILFLLFFWLVGYINRIMELLDIQLENNKQLRDYICENREELHKIKQFLNNKYR